MSSWPATFGSDKKMFVLITQPSSSTLSLIPWLVEGAMDEKGLESNHEDEEDECDLFVAPDGGWGWVIVIATFLTSLVVDGIIFSFGILLPEILLEFGEGQSITSWVGSALAGTYLLIGPIAGALANKFGCRTISIAGSFISTAAFICAFFGDGVLYLIIVYGIIGGIGFGFIYLPSMVIIQTYFEKKRAFATGIAVCGSGIGMFIFSPLTQYLIELYGWRGMVLIQAGISLHCAAFSGLLRPVEDVVHQPHQKLKPLLMRTKEARDAHFRLSVASTDTEYEDKKLPITDSTDSNENFRKLRITNGENKITNQKLNIDYTTSKKKENKWRLRIRCSSPKRKKSVFRRATSADFKRPFFRADMYFSGSLANIPRYVTDSVDAVNKTKESHKRQTIAETINDILHLNLLKSPTFVTICLAGFLTFMGFFVPFIYISDYAVSTGRTKEQSSWLISTIGITNTIGRLICGYITDKPCVKAIYINNSALIISGLSTAMIPFCISYDIQLVYSVIFGLSIACYVSLRSIILVEYLGLEILTNSFGLSLLFQGTASMIGPPVAGWFYKQGDSYDVPFYIAGSVMVLSGLICVPLPYISQWEQKRKEKGKIVKLSHC